MAGDAGSFCGSVRSTSSNPQEVPGISNSRSFNSTCSGSVGSLPRSALRRGKYDPLGPGPGDLSSVAPTSLGFDLSVVYATYGQGTCLYRVLKVQPTATDAEIRRAYLHQGRKTLLDHGLAQKNRQGQYTFVINQAPRKLDDVPHSAREKFKAISIAYEILSQPDTKKEYERYQSLFKPADIARTTSGNSVRWRPYVEEKIFHDSDDERNLRRPSIQKKEEGWLESHLRNLDQEAEMFFNGEFFDELDESIASFQDSLGSLIKQSGSIDKDVKTSVRTGGVEPKEGTDMSKKTIDKDAVSEMDCVSVQQGDQQIIDNPMKSSLRAKAWQKLRRKSTSGISSRSCVTNNTNSDPSITDSPEEMPSHSNAETEKESLFGSFLDSPCSVFDFVLIGNNIDGSAACLADSFVDLLDGKGSTMQRSKRSSKDVIKRKGYKMRHGGDISND
ncbi:hypothetical protein ACHAXS_002457 [Conticribra weissflogii]